MGNQQSQVGQDSTSLPKHREGRRLAILSLAFGVFAILALPTIFSLLTPLISVVAVICGYIAAARIKHARTASVGLRMAIAGIVVGSLGVILNLAVWFPPLQRVREKDRRRACIKNLRHIVLACYEYSNENDGVFPDRLARLYPRYVTALETFRCPSTRHKLPTPDTIEQDGSYVYVHGLTESDPDDSLLMHDKPGNHGSYGRNACYLDSHLLWEPAD